MIATLVSPIGTGEHSSGRVPRGTYDPLQQTAACTGHSVTGDLVAFGPVGKPLASFSRDPTV
jgi:hypothetical protein